MLVKLTQHYIDHELRCPEGKARIELVDSDLPGMYVLVGAAGNTASFFLRHKDRAGKTCHQKIGRTSEISLADARKQAKKLKAEIAANLSGNVNVKQAALIFSRFFEDHYLPFVQTRKRSWRKDEGLYRLKLRDAFGHKLLQDISRKEVQEFHTSLRNEGLAPATADHYAKCMRYALNCAVQWDMLTHNPIARVCLYNADNRRDHYLDDVELQRLLTVLRTDANRLVCQVALFLLSTGLRLEEALSAEWKNIDRLNRTLKIPAATSKSKRVKSIPLNDAAIDILNHLDTEGKFQHVFINQKTGKKLVNVHKTWNRLRNAAGLPSLRLHDLRHWHASALINSGRTLYEVQHILGHSDPKVTQRYAHLSTKSLQDASNCASLAINKAMQVPV